MKPVLNQRKTQPQSPHRAAWLGVLWEKSLEEVFVKFCFGRVDIYHCKHNLFEIEEVLRRCWELCRLFGKERTGEDMKVGEWKE